METQLGILATPPEGAMTVGFTEAVISCPRLVVAAPPAHAALLGQWQAAVSSLRRRTCPNDDDVTGGGIPGPGAHSV